MLMDPKGLNRQDIREKPEQDCFKDNILMLKIV